MCKSWVLCIGAIGLEIMPPDWLFPRLGSASPNRCARAFAKTRPPLRLGLSWPRFVSCFVETERGSIHAKMLGVSAQRDERFHSNLANPSRCQGLRQFRAPNSRRSRSLGFWEAALTGPSNIIKNTCPFELRRMSDGLSKGDHSITSNIRSKPKRPIMRAS